MTAYRYLLSQIPTDEPTNDSAIKEEENDEIRLKRLNF
jgi:hypothetical protein